MPILTVRHVTTYHYKQTVAFGEHRMMLRPRDDDDQKVLESELRITPEPSQLTWTKDIFGNHVATARFADRASEQNFKHVARHEKGTQDPIKTLKLGSGSCRDLAVLMIAALRSFGIAARFVSGYLNLDDDDDDRVTGGNTHAWVQVYVPGPGWVDFDPSSGAVGNRNLVRVAVVREPREAIPLQGTWIGTASDHLTMKVAVKVITAARPTGRRDRPRKFP
jgi:transglutaminase-like putative cysteine protease